MKIVTIRGVPSQIEEAVKLISDMTGAKVVFVMVNMNIAIISSERVKQPCDTNNIC